MSIDSVIKAQQPLQRGWGGQGRIVSKVGMKRGVQETKFSIGMCFILHVMTDTTAVISPSVPLTLNHYLLFLPYHLCTWEEIQKVIDLSAA